MSSNNNNIKSKIPAATVAKLYKGLPAFFRVKFQEEATLGYMHKKWEPLQKQIQELLN